MSFQSTKTYGHDLGLSVCFRQHKAQSHCNQLHGYALAITLTFEAQQLDQRGWVMDFGGLKQVKQMLVDTFDHKLLVARDDPARDEIGKLATAGIADVIVVEATGCEAFASLIYQIICGWMAMEHHTPRVQLVQVEVSEHGANSASIKVPFIDKNKVPV